MLALLKNKFIIGAIIVAASFASGFFMGKGKEQNLSASTEAEAIVHCSDGTKVITRTKEKIVSTNAGNIRAENAQHHNFELGVRQGFVFDKLSRQSPQVYIQAGTECLFLTCFLEISHSIEGRETQGILGAKVSF